MISFQHIETSIAINKKNIIEIINSIVLEENKNVGELSLVFCNDTYLLKINKQFLDHDFFTDVITFDYCEGNVISGDILISLERVKENAELFNVDFLNELHRVIIHGLLHLLKYKDKTKQEKKIMKNKEDYYLNKEWN
tara:strand:+ start:580 stop:993 length:414 start_codon:yes stop_codon:yes gene_type:complete